MKRSASQSSKRRPAGAPKWTTEELDDYKFCFLPPFNKFRGIEIPWTDPSELVVETEWIAKNSRSRKVVKLAAGQFGTPVDVFVKRYNFKSWYGPILRSTRRSRAREEFELGWKLIEIGIMTPRPVWLAEQNGTLPGPSILATEALPDAETIVERWNRFVFEEDRMDLLRCLAEFTRSVHQKGFYHDDFKGEHVLMFPEAPNDPKEFFLIDLLGGRFYQKVSDQRKAKNLYQLVRSFLPKRKNFNFKEKHYHAFLQAYAGSNADTKEWEKKIRKVGKMKGRVLKPKDD